MDKMNNGMKKIKEGILSEPYKTAELMALDKIDNTVCLNINEGKIKFGLDNLDLIDCQDFDQFCECYELVENALLERYRLIQILKKYLIFYGDGGIAFKRLSSKKNIKDYQFLFNLLIGSK